MKKIVIILGCILLCLLVGVTASQFQMEAIAHWYPFLNKSPFTPPNVVFPIAWTLLYILIGISGGLLFSTTATPDLSLIKLFLIQLFVNFLWSMLFFYYQNPLLGLVDIILLDILVFIYIKKAYRHHKISAWLFMPYLLWILFATYLNVYIVLLN